MTEYRVLLVCLGNICRSPTAEAALRHALDVAGLGERVAVDSAGTGAWHVGNPPDPRMISAGAERDLRLDGRARQVTVEDFTHYDLILAMDRTNHEDLVRLAPDTQTARRIRMFREFEADADGTDVPDPYFGGSEGFLLVVDMVRAGADGVVAHIREQIG